MKKISLIIAMILLAFALAFDYYKPLILISYPVISKVLPYPLYNPAWLLEIISVFVLYPFFKSVDVSNKNYLVFIVLIFSILFMEFNYNLSLVFK